MDALYFMNKKEKYQPIKRFHPLEKMNVCKRLIEICPDFSLFVLTGIKIFFFID